MDAQAGSGLNIREVAGGVEFEVLATPGSSVSKIRGLHGSALKVALRSPPEKGKANEELCAVLAKALGVPARQIEVVRGMTSRQKCVRVLGATPAAVAVLAGGGK